MKQMMWSRPAIAFFDPRNDIVRLSLCDAQQKDIIAALLQNNAPLHWHQGMTSEVHSSSMIMASEPLGVVFAC